VALVGSYNPFYPTTPTIPGLNKYMNKLSVSISHNMARSSVAINITLLLHTISDKDIKLGKNKKYI